MENRGPQTQDPRYEMSWRRGFVTALARGVAQSASEDARPPWCRGGFAPHLRCGLGFFASADSPLGVDSVAPR